MIDLDWRERVGRLSAAQRGRLAERLWQAAQAQAEAAVESVRLVAYVVLREPAAVTEAELLDFLGRRLPPAILPSRFVFLPELPVLPSGKVDRHALPDPRPERHGLDARYQAPRTATERALARIWSEVLGEPSIGVHDSFWSIGGQSVEAMRIVARARHVFHTELPAEVLLKAPTIAEQARRLEAASPLARAAVPLVAVPRDQPLPLSSAQLRHWFLQLLEPDSAAYNTYDAVRVRGPLDVDALELALTGIVRRHEILRTRYLDVRGVPVQAIEATAPCDLPVDDLRRLPAEDREPAALEAARAGIRGPFDLAALPLLRCRLLRLADDHHILVLVAHHVVADDWGFNVLFRELSEGYSAGLEPAAPEPRPLPVQYADYAVWERRVLGDELGRGLAHWRRELAGAPPGPALPPDFPRPARRGDRSAVTPFKVAEPALGALTAWCRRRATTVFAVALATLAEVLGRASGQEDVVIGVPFANRGRPELERMIGCFINPAAVRIDRSGQPGHADLVARAQRAIQAAHSVQHVPFEKVVEALRLAREPGRPLLFQAVLNFSEAPTLPRLRGTEVGRVDLGAALPPKYDLTLYLESAVDALVGRVMYDPDLYAPETISDFVGDFVGSLAELAAGDAAITLPG